MSQIHMTAAEYQEHITNQSRSNKYRNRRTKIKGISFDSQAEADRYVELKFLTKINEINGFVRQPSFILNDGEKPIRYRPDFMVCDNDGFIWVEDVKGFQTPEFKLKRKLWQIQIPWLELRIIGGKS